MTGGKKQAPREFLKVSELRKGKAGQYVEESLQKIEKARKAYNAYIRREFKKDPQSDKWARYYQEIKLTTNRENKYPTISKKSTPEEIVEALQSLESFNTHDAEKMRSIETTAKKLFEKSGYKYTEKDERKLLSIFKSTDWKKLQEEYNSDVILDDINYLIENQKSVKEIKGIMRNFVRSDKKMSFGDYVSLRTE